MPRTTPVTIKVTDLRAAETAITEAIAAERRRLLKLADKWDETAAALASREEFMFDRGDHSAAREVSGRAFAYRNCAADLRETITGDPGA